MIPNRVACQWGIVNSILMFYWKFLTFKWNVITHLTVLILQQVLFFANVNFSTTRCFRCQKWPCLLFDTLHYHYPDRKDSVLGITNYKLWKFNNNKPYEISQHVKDMWCSCNVLQHGINRLYWFDVQWKVRSNQWQNRGSY